MINSANQYPVYSLLSHEGNLTYRVPPYQREYSWQKAQWEDLFQDLIEADGAHFLGTIITVNQTTDAVQSGVLELIDGQQRMTTLTILLAAVFSVLKEHDDELDDDTRTDLTNLGRRLVRKSDGALRVTPQTQGHNLDDYRTVLAKAGLKVQSKKQPYFGLRRISRCYEYFRSAISELAESEVLSPVEAAMRVFDATQRAIIVKIEVVSHADAFVLFESLNNRGMPLTPVDLIKNHMLAESDRTGAMNLEDAFSLWNEMLANLGDNYATHERFLRHYYNAFKSELPEVPKAPIATRTRLIRIYESLLEQDIKVRIDDLVEASSVYGRIACVTEQEAPTNLDHALRRLMRAQGAPSYMLVLWLLNKSETLGLSESDHVAVVDRLTGFFARRNLTGYPQGHTLPKLFMSIIDEIADQPETEIVNTIKTELRTVSSSNPDFRERLEGPIYDENVDVARFILTSLAEEQMTKETWVDLWSQEKGHYIWTIEHILPQGGNLPQAWNEMLGGPDNARDAQSAQVHRLGNLTITAYNSNLSNKGFLDKRDRTDTPGRFIGYKNGLSLNSALAEKESWTVDDIEARTQVLTAKVLELFPLE